MIAEAVPACAYNPVSNMAGFHDEYLRVIIGKDHMDIYGTDEPELVEYIIDKLIKAISGRK